MCVRVRARARAGGEGRRGSRVPAGRPPPPASFSLGTLSPHRESPGAGPDAGHRTWTDKLEKIMKRYIDLCVDLRKIKMARDGLVQYRISCQSVNIGSLEDVIKHFLSAAEAKANDSQREADMKVRSLHGPSPTLAARPGQSTRAARLRAP